MLEIRTTNIYCTSIQYAFVTNKDNDMSIINSLYNNNLTKNKTWLNIENLEGQLTIAKQYADICLQHEKKNKWILMVDPEVKSIESLSLNSKINTANILRVNSHKQGLKLNNIKKG